MTASLGSYEVAMEPGSFDATGIGQDLRIGMQQIFKLAVGLLCCCLTNGLLLGACLRKQHIGSSPHRSSQTLNAPTLGLSPKQIPGENGCR